MYLPTKDTLLKKRSVKGLFDDVYAIFFLFLFSILKHMLLVLIWISSTGAIQMGTYNIYTVYIEVDKKHTGCNLKTIELLHCAFIGVCMVIRVNIIFHSTK